MPLSAADIRRYWLHALRIAIFAAIILLIHLQHSQSSRSRIRTVALKPDDVSQLFPNVASIGPTDPNGSVSILDQEGIQLGQAIQTSPQSDHIIGFSGPTNTLLAFDVDGKIRGLRILSSDDTRDHVNQILADSNFLKSLDGLTREEAADKTSLDAVSGATLTCLAIHESILNRLGKNTTSLRFPDPPTVDDIQALFPSAASLEADKHSALSWRVLDQQEAELGTVLRTAPAADNHVGYQGPTNTIAGFNQQGKIIGIAVRQSYDNVPYVDYVREDKYFAKQFNGLQLNELASLDLAAAGVEGVSGATMTSMTVAEGLKMAAESHLQQIKSTNNSSTLLGSLTSHDYGTAAVIIAGTIIGLTPLRANKILRVACQLLLIGYLGLTAGNVLSQAMLVGWAQYGVPWKSAAGLVMLSVAALSLPIFTRHNIYCTHLCPHGAAQQLLKRRWFQQPRLPRTVITLFQLIPALLLAWCLVVGMTSIGFSLVDVEPFDAYIFQVAGWATITIAIVGLVASLFIPMAYCRYGCPTGAILNFLRFNTKSDRWSIRDSVALGYLAIAVLLWVANRT